MSKIKVIAIDGPAGSGKSTVAKLAALSLGFLYIDTGAMYRALTYKAIKRNIDFEDKNALIELSCDMDIELKTLGSSLKVYLDREDVTDQIRTMEVTRKVRFLASLKDIRENMVKLQRKLGCSADGAVLEGRDIGTVVFPDAEYKFYLDADCDTRANRRFEELKEKGIDTTLEEIKHDVEVRDRFDMTRSVGPLKKAKDAHIIDTTKMTITEVVDKILKVV